MAAPDFNKPSSLPPYPEMILGAIAALDEKNGANKTTISKYIESKYGDLPAGHTTLLTHHLNRMKNTGELIFWKNNYIKPDPNAPPRRGRGRPPKDPNAPPKPVKPKLQPTVTASGKPRGRPRKIPRSTEEVNGTSTSTIMAMAAGSGRPRGRPPKVKPASVTEVSVQN